MPQRPPKDSPQSKRLCDTKFVTMPVFQFNGILAQIQRRRAGCYVELSYGRVFTKFRKQHKDVFVYGDFELLDPDHSQVHAYRRFSNNKVWVLTLNFSGQSVALDILPKVKLKDWVAGNYKVSKLEHDPRGRHPHALLGLQDGKDAHFRMQGLNVFPA